MRLYLGGFFAFYIQSAAKQPKPWLEFDLLEPVALTAVLESLGIPPAEVHLAAVNGQLVNLDEAIIDPGDEVRIYPPIGGG